MYPFDEDEDEELEEEKSQVPREYEVDFTTGQLTGRIVEGLEAIKVWVWLALNTERYHYPQYSWEYGNETEELIGQAGNVEYMESEAERMLRDCLLGNPYITDLEEVDITLENDRLHYQFILDTVYGEAEMYV